MQKDEAFEIAIIDGINIYVREALKSKGFLDRSKEPFIACDELLDIKYRIAKELAAKWAKVQLEEEKKTE
jgi:hypothetical protein